MTMFIMGFLAALCLALIASNTRMRDERIWEERMRQRREDELRGIYVVSETPRVSPIRKFAAGFVAGFAGAFVREFLKARRKARPGYTSEYKCEDIKFDDLPMEVKEQLKNLK